MVQLRTAFRLRAVIMALIALGACMFTQSALAQYKYLPTAHPHDARMLAIAGAGFNTITQDTIYVALISESNQSNLNFGIFDGETGGAWDQGSTNLIYKLYTDPLGTGAGVTLLATYGGDSMSNDAWYNISRANNSGAVTTNGRYMYVLKVYSSNPASTHLSAFKVRCWGTIALLPNQSFNFIAPMSSTTDANNIYPAYPNLTSTTYDGTWNWWLDVPAAASSFTAYDGDMDFGNYVNDTTDSDDADSPSSVPSWASSTVARNEGVAFGDTTGAVSRTGYPTDNSRWPIFRRGKSVTYDLFTPNNTQFTNSNPSGNLEWEQFKLSTATYNASTMDYHADSLPKGFYKARVNDMDLGNQNSFRFSYYVLGVDTSGTPTDPTPTDITPPEIDVEITGAQGCWPPNKRLWELVIHLEFSDDRAPASVVLDSVNISDSSFQSFDISGASLGTYDTVFSVRCDQASSVSNRVYTIVYKITDSAGNVTYGRAYYEVSNIYAKGDNSRQVVTGKENVVVGTSYPNPFTNVTTADYTLKSASDVSLAVYSTNGEKIRTFEGGWRDAGNYSVKWDGRDDAGNVVPAGMYILHVGAGDCDCGQNVEMVFLGQGN